MTKRDSVEKFSLRKVSHACTQTHIATERRQQKREKMILDSKHHKGTAAFHRGNFPFCLFLAHTQFFVIRLEAPERAAPDVCVCEETK